MFSAYQLVSVILYKTVKICIEAFRLTKYDSEGEEILNRNNIGGAFKALY